jgi:two-component system response regulator YesN
MSISKKRILMADDEQRLLDSMKVLIDMLDYEVEVYFANNGKQALKLIKRSDIDLLITDIYMPDMDGLELIREVRKKYSSIKILGISGTGNHYLEVAKAFGASYVLNKPFETGKFISTIHKMLS